MSEPLLLAIDAGTGSCRAALFNESGRQVSIGQREYSHHALASVPGSQVFDTERNWGLIAVCIREALERAEAPRDAVQAVSATSMREGMVLWDGYDSELWACPNVDSRAGAEAAELVQSGAAQEIYETTGDWVAITAPARFLWIARNAPEILAKTRHVGMLADWILTRLSGEYVTDPSLGSSSGMFDLARRRWSERILELCGLDARVFPRVVESGTVIGAVTKDAAAETGLRPGTPVVTGGADTQLGLLGIGVADPGRFTIVGGSFWQHTIVLDEPLIDPEGRLRTLCHVAPSRWMMEGIGFYSGATLRWFRDAFCELEQSRARERAVDTYAILEEQAAEVPPGAHGVVGLFSNLMQANRWVHGPSGFLGFDVTRPNESGRAACVRAIEESAAYVSLGHLRIIQDLLGIDVQEAVLTGGASNGRLWPQIVADTLGIPVRIPVVKESSALGAALCAGAGVGSFRDAAEASARLASFERTFEPDVGVHSTYEELYGRWLETVGTTLGLANNGLVRPLWRAPGT